jgi:hypothetical protein
MALQGFSEHTGEYAMEVKRREAGQARQIFKVQRLVQLLLDMDKNTEDSLLIILERNWPARFVHWTQLHQNARGERLMVFANNARGSCSRLLEKTSNTSGYAEKGAG